MGAALDPDRLDRQFFALSDSTRRALVERLGKGPASVTELVEPLHLSMPSVVKHLAVLEAGELVESEKSGRVRTYRLSPGAFASIERWVGLRKSRLQADFDRLDRVLATKRKEPRE